MLACPQINQILDVQLFVLLFKEGVMFDWCTDPLQSWNEDLEGHYTTMLLTLWSPKSRQGGASLSSRGRPPSMNQCSFYGLNLQLGNGGGSSHPPSRGESNHARRHPHRFSEFTTKSESPDRNVSMVMVDIHLRKLLWMYCPGHARVKGNDPADRLAGKASQLACISEDLLVGTKPRTSHHWLSQGERRGKRKL